MEFEKISLHPGQLPDLSDFNQLMITWRLFLTGDGSLLEHYILSRRPAAVHQWLSMGDIGKDPGCKPSAVCSKTPLPGHAANPAPFFAWIRYRYYILPPCKRLRRPP
jgi:hypothetical protein